MRIASSRAVRGELRGEDGRAETGGVTGKFRLVEGHAHVRLGGQVVDLVRRNCLQQRGQPRAIGQVGVVQIQPCLTLVRILVQVIDPVGIEGAGPADQAVHLVPLAQE